MADLAIMSFNAGEWSPHLDGRSDLEKYYSACRLLENMIPLPYGDAERRPGTYFVAEIKDSSKKARLVPFQYSTEQAYILEYGDEYIRFYKDRGQIEKGAGTEDLSGIGSIVAHWLLNDDEATDVVLDDDGETHNGVATSNTEDLHEAGVVGTGCFNLNGISAVEINDSGDFDFGDGTDDSVFSIIAWVYITGTSGNAVILSKWDTGAKRQWRLNILDSGKLRFILADQSVSKYPYRDSDSALTTGWHLIGATYDGGGGATAANGITLYVDGVAIDSTATNEATYTAMEDDLTSKVAIGASYLAGTLSLNWADKIDEVAIFSKELTATEMASLYSTTAVEESSSYLEADLFGIQTVQSADVLYNVHSDYAPSKLMRYAHDDWELADIVFDWPPFLTENSTDITITPTNGAPPLAIGTSVTLTASAALFTPDQVGSFWLIKHPRTADEAIVPNTVRKEMSAAAPAAGGISDWLKDVKGSWRMRTSGVWTGRIIIERSYDEGSTYHGVGDAYESVSDQNFNIAGNEEEGDAWLRVKCLEYTDDTIVCNLSCERYYHYGIVKITAFTSSTVVTAEVINPLNSEEATKLWSEGAWSDERGYPASVAFYEGRQFYAGTSYRPLNLWGSRIADYENMIIGTLDDDPVKFTVDSGEQNAIRWMVGHEVMLIGTSGGEWRLGSVDPADAITPTNPMRPKQQTAYGSKEVQALLLANVILFVDAGGKSVRGAQYIFERGETGGYDAPNYTMMAEHITKSGIVGIAYQQNPYPTLWCVRDDGVLAGMVFEPGQKVWGWFRCVIDGDVESVGVIPGTTEGEVWIIVKREINGETKRYIEYFKPRDWGDDQADCFFVDSGLTFDGGAAVTITGITKAEPGVVTAVNTFSDGDQVKIRGVAGMKDVNNKVFTVDSPATDTFSLRDKLDTVDWDTTGYDAFSDTIEGDTEYGSDIIKNVSAADIASIVTGAPIVGTGIAADSNTTITEIGDDWFTISTNATKTNAAVSFTVQGTVEQVDNIFSGLGHLEGKTVSVLGDGAVHADVVVSSGVVTLTDYFNKVHIGLPFASALKPMKLAFPGANIRGKKKRIHQIIFSFYKTLGAKFGPTQGDNTIPFRKTTDPVGFAPPLFTDEKTETFSGGYELEGNIYVEQTQPLPMTVRTITVKVGIYG